MLQYKNIEDREEMMNYHRARDMINLLIYFPELSPILDLTIVKSLEDYYENYEELKDLKVEKEELERKKKVLLSSLLYMSDNVYSINHMIMNRINRYHFIDYTIRQKIKDVNMDTMKEITEKLNFSNRTLFFVEPKK